MAIDRLSFANITRFGYLIKTWATGRNYLNDGNQYPLPESLDEFRRQNSQAQTGVSIPGWAKKIKFVACEDDTLVIRIPPRRLIEDSEERLTQSGAAYPLSDIYKKVFGGVDPVIPADKMLDFHAARMGEYTSNMCT